MITEPPSPPTPGESLDDVKSRRFSQEHCEPEDSHTGQTVRKVPNEGTRTPSGWTVVTACAKDTTDEYKEMVEGFFAPSTDHIETWTVTWRESIFLAIFFCCCPLTIENVKKILTPPKKCWLYLCCKFKPFLLVGQMKGVVSLTQ